jgi:hypothetical protein
LKAAIPELQCNICDGQGDVPVNPSFQVLIFRSQHAGHGMVLSHQKIRTDSAPRRPHNKSDGSVISMTASANEWLSALSTNFIGKAVRPINIATIINIYHPRRVASWRRKKFSHLPIDEPKIRDRRPGMFKQSSDCRISSLTNRHVSDRIGQKKQHARITLDYFVEIS